jgi:hypothetical protein
MGLGEKLWWGRKHFSGAIERAQPSQGYTGLRETLEVLDAEGIGAADTARTPDAQNDIPVLNRGDSVGDLVKNAEDFIRDRASLARRIYERGR